MQFTKKLKAPNIWLLQSTSTEDSFHKCWITHFTETKTNYTAMLTNQNRELNSIVE